MKYILILAAFCSIACGENFMEPISCRPEQKVEVRGGYLEVSIIRGDCEQVQCWFLGPYAVTEKDLFAFCRFLAGWTE